jgi:CBS domain-containing protein
MTIPRTVKVFELMTRDVKTCGCADMVEHAAHIMWTRDCGCVPVVDGDGHVVGMVTDRDVCMAAYTQGRPRDVAREAAREHVPATRELSAEGFVQTLAAVCEPRAPR